MLEGGSNAVITEQPQRSDTLPGNSQQSMLPPPSRPRASNQDGNLLQDFVQNRVLQPMGPVEGCPTGLEYLLVTQDLLVEQEVDPVELVSNQISMGLRIEMPNKYNILNTAGARIYYAAEQGVQGSGMGRAFTIIVYDFAGRAVLKLERPRDPSYGQCSTACNCSGRSGGNVKVSLGDDTPLGSVFQEANGTQPLFNVYDDARKVLAVIKGPPGSDGCCHGLGCCHTTAEFKLFMPNGEETGVISKKWGGDHVETYTNADNFGVVFGVDLDVRIKALLLGAVFLIDFIFFEEAPDRPKRRSHRLGAGIRRSNR